MRRGSLYEQLELAVAFAGDAVVVAVEAVRVAVGATCGDEETLGLGVGGEVGAIAVGAGWVVAVATCGEGFGCAGGLVGWGGSGRTSFNYAT